MTTQLDNLTKPEAREVRRVLAALTANLIAPDRAAAALAVLHRSARRSVNQWTITQVMQSEGLLSYVHQVNGALVPRFN
jgi:hypothetical protein